MATLLHLNGPPGVGKSTLAQRYVDEHPGALNLEIDTVASLVGGWREDFFGVLSAARALAIAMADAHLRAGCNVVMPQLVTSVEEAQLFEGAAVRVGAAYVEIALGVDRGEQLERFSVKAATTQVTAQIHRVVAQSGGDELMERIHRQFDTYLEHRQAAVRLDTSGREASESYARMREIVIDR